VRGAGRYLDDLGLPGMAHAAFVRSPHAHARILAVRPPPVADGLLAVLTAEDLAGRVQPLPIPALDGAWLAAAPHPVLAVGEVCYVGQPVAAVIASSPALAEDALELVEVDYEPLPAVVEPRQAEQELMRWTHCFGDVAGAFARAAHVVRANHRIPRLAAAPIEPRGALAAHAPDEDLLTVWVSAQDPHRPLAQLAHALHRPPERIRVIVPEVGGAFGSKGVIALEAVLVAFAAIELGRPIKWVEDRSENLIAAYQGRGLELDVELALDADGRMLALRAGIVADLGAYLLPTTAVPPHTAAMLMTGCYEIPAAAVSVSGVRTNKVPTGPCRGAGRPEAAYALERTVESASRALGLDPVELRRRNLIRSFPHRTPLGWTYDSGDFLRCLELAAALVRAERSAGRSRVVGTGLAMCVERGGGMWESARVQVAPDGRVIAASGSSPHGQGHETTFAQIISDQLGVAPDAIELRFGDTALVPRGVGTFASRSVAMGGSALVLACEQLRARAARIAASELAIEEGELFWAGGGFVAGDGRAATLAQLAAAADRAGCQLEACASFRSELVFSSGAYAAVVEIERDTGRLTVRRLVAVDDAGTIVNPLLAEGQVHGGVIQGLGACLGEEVTYDQGGQPRNASFAAYGLPTAAEQPPLLAAFVHTPSPHNPLGAKGIGEAGAIGTPAAVANAIADALGGAVPDPPFTPEKLWQALRSPRRDPDGHADQD
jgi:carbon-monoxide dehydrogenase large subunit